MLEHREEYPDYIQKRLKDYETDDRWKGALARSVMDFFVHARRYDKPPPWCKYEIPEEYLWKHGWTRAAEHIISKWGYLTDLSYGCDNVEEELTKLVKELEDIAKEWASRQEYIRLFGHYYPRADYNESCSPVPHFYTASYSAILAARDIRNHVLMYVCTHRFRRHSYDDPPETFYKCNKCGMTIEEDEEMKEFQDAVFVDFMDRDMSDIVREAEEDAGIPTEQAETAEGGANKEVS